jgi:TATA-binding protein-associated factor
MNIASSVVTQQNAGLGSMNTGDVLDLFRVSADGDPAKTSKANTGAVTASKVLEGFVITSSPNHHVLPADERYRLEDFPPDDEYSELSMSNFMSKM